MSEIKLNNISKSFADNLLILNNVSLTVENGSSIAIVGNSGTGKSTLLHIAGLLDKPTSGSVTLDGQDCLKMTDTEQSYLRNKRIGFIFQSHMLLEDFTVLENVMVPLWINGEKNQAEKKAKELLDRVGLSERLYHYPSQISGGEKQRTAICRSLVNNPDFILADEPTGNLDEENALITENILLNIVKNEKKSLLLVTHNPSFAAKCSQIYELRNHTLRKVNL